MDKFSPRPRFRWDRLARITRLTLGGVIVGSFGGVYLGALLGLLVAACAGDLSAALDGALLGGAALALLGGGYGTVLGVTERNTSADLPVYAGPALVSPPSPDTDAIPSHQVPPAGRLDPNKTPEMEHAHGR